MEGTGPRADPVLDWLSLKRTPPRPPGQKGKAGQLENRKTGMEWRRRCIASSGKRKPVWSPPDDPLTTGDRTIPRPVGRRGGSGSECQVQRANKSKPNSMSSEFRRLHSRDLPQRLFLGGWSDGGKVIKIQRGWLGGRVRVEVGVGVGVGAYRFLLDIFP